MHRMYGEPIHHSQHEREQSLRSEGEHLRLGTILEQPVSDHIQTCAGGELGVG